MGRWALVWGGLVIAMTGPVLIAATSPWLAGRGALYIFAGFAGIVALALMLLQPLLASGLLPGLGTPRARRWHRWVGSGIVGGIVLHVAALYITSPPDVIDVLLFASPTPFSVYGVVGLWSAVVVAVLVALRGRLGWRPALWKGVHAALVSVVVVSSVVHALMIEGTMGTVSKWILCALALAATGGVILHLRIRRHRTPAR